MEQRYNIYFAGQILDGHQASSVREGLAKLFKADEATLARLFSGKAQLIKKNCDKATALKYKQAMERAGAKPMIKIIDDPAPAPKPSDEIAEGVSAAEKIAALASAPDAGSYCTESTPTASVDDSSQTGDLDLCPDGTDVLKPEERAQPITANIDTTGMEVDSAAQRLSEEPPPPPAAPSTDHLSMGEVGETIPTLPAAEAPLNPDTSAISLAPEGTDFSDCNPPDAPAPDLDLSAINLAPEGTEVLTEEERGDRPAAPPPDSEHITLSE